jgi:hypothetical protein
VEFLRLGHGGTRGCTRGYRSIGRRRLKGPDSRRRQGRPSGILGRNRGLASRPCGTHPKPLRWRPQSA